MKFSDRFDHCSERAMKTLPRFFRSRPNKSKSDFVTPYFLE
jgi:hypothetical protein